MAFQIYSTETLEYLASLSELKFDKEGLSWSAKCGAKRVLKKILTVKGVEHFNLVIIGSKGRDGADPKKVKKSKKACAEKAGKELPDNYLWDKAGVNKKCAKCAKACKQNAFATIINCGDYVKA